MFIEIEVKSSIIIHGYDNKNKEIEEVFDETDFMKKIISINRIQSISEEYILVKSSHGRIMYWKYKGTMEELKQRLLSVDIKIA
jgi:glycerol-3-phosphate cytidylyltransferase-like family protein